jgi:hypothetical protein
MSSALTEEEEVEHIFQQIVGIPMGTTCASLLADLFLKCTPMRQFLCNNLSKTKNTAAKAFNLTSRCVVS